MRVIQHLAIFALAGAMATPTWACMCTRTATFAQVLEDAPIVIEGQVTPAPQDKERNYFSSVNVSVNKVLKGKFSEKPTPANVTLTDPFMCYKSIRPEELTKGSTYVLALFPEPNEQHALRARRNSKLKQAAPPKTYTLSTCAETAVLLDGAQVFTFTRRKEPNYQPQPKAYGSYEDLLRQIEVAKSKKPWRPGQPRKSLPDEPN